MSISEASNNNNNLIVQRGDDRIIPFEGNLNGRSVVAASDLHPEEDRIVPYQPAAAKKWLIVACKVMIATVIISGFIAASIFSFGAAAAAAPGLSFLFSTLGAASGIAAKAMLYRSGTCNMHRYTNHNGQDVADYLFFLKNKLPRLIAQFFAECWNKLSKNPAQIKDKLDGIGGVIHAAEILAFPIPESPPHHG